MILDNVMLHLYDILSAPLAFMAGLLIALAIASGLFLAIANLFDSSSRKEQG